MILDRFSPVQFFNSGLSAMKALLAVDTGCKGDASAVDVDGDDEGFWVDVDDDGEGLCCTVGVGVATLPTSAVATLVRACTAAPKSLEASWGSLAGALHRFFAASR